MPRTLQAPAPTDLRTRAASRLTGADGTEGATSRAVNALAVLHALASSPATASDALALLHELQVLQVELDLQAEELRESRTELEARLRRQTEFCDALPVACLWLDRELVIREANLMGAAMLGVGRDGVAGQRLDNCLTADGLRTLRALLAGMDEGGRRSGLLPWRSGAGLPQTFHAAVGPAPTGAGFLLALMTVEEASVEETRGA
jgi:PAS domain-containing protein